MITRPAHLLPGADRENAARRISLHELVDELAEGDSDHGFSVYLSFMLDGHRAVVIFLIPAPEELDGAATFQAFGGPGLLRDHAHDHSRHRRGLLLHRDHLHSSRWDPHAPATFAQPPQTR